MFKFLFGAVLTIVLLVYLAIRTFSSFKEAIITISLCLGICGLLLFGIWQIMNGLQEMGIIR